MTPNEAAALARAKVAVQAVESALSRAKWTQDVQALRAKMERLGLRLAHARAGSLLRTLDDRDRRTGRRR